MHSKGVTASAELARLEKLIPPEKLAAILRRIADRAEERCESEHGGEIVVTLHFGGGKFRKATERLDGRIA